MSMRETNNLLTKIFELLKEIKDILAVPQGKGESKEKNPVAEALLQDLFQRYPFQGLEDIISSADHLSPEEKTLLEDKRCQVRLRRIRDARKREMKDFISVNDGDEAEVLRAYVKKHGKLSSPILVFFRVMQSAGEERMENAPALRLFNELLEQPLEGFKESYEGDVQL